MEINVSNNSCWLWYIPSDNLLIFHQIILPICATHFSLFFSVCFAFCFPNCQSVFMKGPFISCHTNVCHHFLAFVINPYYFFVQLTILNFLINRLDKIPVCTWEPCLVTHSYLIMRLPIAVIFILMLLLLELSVIADYIFFWTNMTVTLKCMHRVEDWDEGGGV